MSLREIFGIATPTRSAETVEPVALERVDALCGRCRQFLQWPTTNAAMPLTPISVTCVCGWKGQATFLRRQG